MSLFQTGAFILHSGDPSTFKIDCDALTDADWAALAKEIAARVAPFTEVVGIPRGGLKLAEALKPYRTQKLGGAFLIVDDVLTTGRSMEEAREEHEKKWSLILGAVVFARTSIWPWWITPLFEMRGF